MLVHTLADHFAQGINYVRVRAALVPTLRWPFSMLTAVVNLRWERICSCLAVSSAICAFFFLTQLVFYLVHSCFTLLVRGWEESGKRTLLKIFICRCSSVSSR